MCDAARPQVNADWKAQRLDVVVATVAFGMGLDRPSKMPEGYIQLSIFASCVCLLCHV